MIKNLYVNKTYCAHFHLSKFPDHPLNIYGIKSEDEIYKIAAELINSNLFCKAYYSVNWKEIKRGRWHREEFIFLKDKLNEIHNAPTQRD